MSQKRGNMIENIIVGVIVALVVIAGVVAWFGVIVALVVIAGVVAWWFENHGEDIPNPDEKKLQDKK